MLNYGNVESEFVALFSGKFDVSLRGFTYIKTFEWLSEGDSLKKALTCMVFFQKPLKFLETGLTKKNKGDGKGVDKKVIKWLPMLTDDEASSVTNEFRVKSIFKKVNFTQVRNTALLFAQHGPYQGLVMQFIRKWGARPLQINTEAYHASDDQTQAIMAETLDTFRADRIIHDAYNWSGFFN